MTTPLINNTQQVSDNAPCLTNGYQHYWYDPILLQGNYWSDYTGIDTNGDGIGDTLIPHPGACYDEYPYVNPLTYTLTVTTAGTGSGTVTSSPGDIDCGTDCSEDYSYGTPVTLTATPDTNNYFNGWNGCDSPSGNTCTMTLDTNKAVIANFTTWSIETIDSNGCVGEYTSIATDSSGKVHISYYDCTNGDLKYATNRGVTPGTGNCINTDFNCETVDSEGDVGQYSDIAIDLNNKVHISYYDATNGDLKYATNKGVIPGNGNCTNTNWNCQPVDSNGIVGLYTSIALDSSYRPHIGYVSGVIALPGFIGEEVRHAYYNGSEWNIEIVDIWSNYPYGEFYSTSIAIDSLNRIHMSYYNYYCCPVGVIYAYYNGVSWSTMEVDRLSTCSREWAQGFTSIAIDSLNNPHISYYHDGPSLRHASYNGTAWQTETIDSNGVGWYSSLVFDSSYNMHISYYDSSNSNLKYATNRGVTPGTGTCTNTNWDCIP